MYFFRLAARSISPSGRRKSRIQRRVVSVSARQCQSSAVSSGPSEYSNTRQVSRTSPRAPHRRRWGPRRGGAVPRRVISTAHNLNPRPERRAMSGVGHRPPAVTCQIRVAPFLRVLFATDRRHICARGFCECSPFAILSARRSFRRALFLICCVCGFVGVCRMSCPVAGCVFSIAVESASLLSNFSFVYFVFSCFKTLARVCLKKIIFDVIFHFYRLF